jgi:hypothetical protein
MLIKSDDRFVRNDLSDWDLVWIVLAIPGGNISTDAYKVADAERRHTTLCS